MTHYDFAFTVFPEHYKPTQSLCPILKEMMGTELGPSSALHLIGPYFPYWPHFTADQREVIQQWIILNFGH